MNKRNVLLPSICLSVLVSSAPVNAAHTPSWVDYRGQAPAAGYVESAASLPLIPVAPLADEDLGNGLRITTKETKAENSAPAFTINAKIPEMTGPSSDARPTRFNKEVSDLIGGQIARFKKSVEQAAQGQPVRRTSSSIAIDYQITYASSILLSVAFSVDFQLPGAAHPDRQTRCLTFDVKSGTLLTMAEIFKPETDFLTILAEYCMSHLGPPLGRYADQGWIKRGASARTENYTVWNITKTGMEITFDPGHVARYEAGTQQVIVPYGVLRPLVATGSPVYALT
jgi:hypothetical protein